MGIWYARSRILTCQTFACCGCNQSHENIVHAACVRTRFGETRWREKLAGEKTPLQVSRTSTRVCIPWVRGVTWSCCVGHSTAPVTRHAIRRHKSISCRPELRVRVFPSFRRRRSPHTLCWRGFVRLTRATRSISKRALSTPRSPRLGCVQGGRMSQPQVADTAPARPVARNKRRLLLSPKIRAPAAAGSEQ